LLVATKTRKHETGDVNTMRLLRSVHWLILAFLLILAIPSTSSAQVAVGISVHIGPPALPVYAQPVIPGPGYLWTPGYWAYGPDGYYWVPGTWVLPPSAGLLWTPGYWGWAGGLYVWHGGYWGPHVGFYGGINYGFGFTGVGFAGGYWRGGAFFYNRAVTNVNTTIIHNSYHTEVVERGEVSHASFNGGTGGTTARPTPEEMRAENEHHVAPTTEQSQHEHAASTNREMLASANHGRPAVAATARPGEFRGAGAASARNENAESARTNESRNTSQKAESKKAQSKAKKQNKAERSEGSKEKPRR
jgi:WXXGXW repeat (2 copies)